MTRSRRRPEVGATAPALVVWVGDAPEWQPELGSLLAAEGYAIERIVELDAALPLVMKRSVQAILLAARPLAASNVLLLGRIRELSPQTAVVVVTRTPTDPDLKRAFENGATAFLSWPASAEAMRRALDRGAFLASTGSRQ